MTDHELDSLIADAMTKVEAFLARGVRYDNVAIVVTPLVYCKIARSTNYQRCEDIRIGGDVYYGRYHGIDLYVIENAPEENMCFPAFRCDEPTGTLTYAFQCETTVPIHSVEHLIFGNSGDLYRTEDGVAFYDSGMRVIKEIPIMQHQPVARKVQKPEPDLQPTPELDEFIEQFRRSG